MGDARRRRLALIKGGKADQAKAIRIAPERLTNLTIQMPTVKVEIAHEIYKTKVDKSTCPTPNDFWQAVFDAGMMEFEKFYAAENAPKPADFELPLTPDPIVQREAVDIELAPDEGGQG